ncbi:MAG: hypothetical protein COW01_05050 [Bdellovibrionales bacterium CG12_big_fil_rev_8_21_14_0_65_38_15]|nr:MAG: hypothetical protein COW79_14330 [Bdellovibrionales bacterium CG22_combo_CG10-13_8_21_14_all_38_13]PIQ56252.1 MAG: hypothetical protein COW01_05050 [Bdellovibrionales bacterium CG12_big_fil_rev_8_21_14_0_65_38_15]PIR30396.1 MAG: hypothetical protein COV38_06495 [Bdellovibrionales bacterium CG11_big_fil_rev_8_21_14_0_20_38_13]
MKIIFILIVMTTFNCFGADCIAHRGYLRESVENSLDSVINAINAGADGVEFDIHHTKDGTPFLLHDSTLERVVDDSIECPSKTKVKDLLWSEISQHCRLKDGQRLVSLEELLIQTANYKGLYFVELKDKPSHLFKDVVESSGVDFSRLRFISFRLKFLQVVRDFIPESQSLRLSKFIPFFAWSRGMNVHYPLKPFTWLARMLGHENGVWTVNDYERLLKYHKRKVDFITTDEIELCLKAQSQDALN